MGVPPDWPFVLSVNNNVVIFLTNIDFVCINNLALDNSVFITLEVNCAVLFIGSQYSAPSGDIYYEMDAYSAHFLDYDRILILGDFNLPRFEFGYTRLTDRT